MYNDLYCADHYAGPLTKTELQYPYTPPPGMPDDAALQCEPDRPLLNRSKWNAVLYFVNKFANEHANGNRKIALKAERLIQTSVPENIRSHEYIEQWLLKNWEHYPFV